MSTKQKIQFWKNSGLCYRCGNRVVHGRKMCEKHLEESREKEKKKRAKRKNKNLCIRCGKIPPRENKTQCEQCSSLYKDDYNKRKMDIYYQRKSAMLCVRCGAKVGKHEVHCSNCQEYMRKKDKNSYYSKKRKSLCVHCGSDNPIKDEILCQICKSKNKTRGSINRKKNKFNIIQHYGGVCSCCGENRIEFLSVDHIDGGGNQHNQKLRKEGTTLYRWLIKNNFPPGFQVLCYNCNTARYHNGGTCPHKQTKVEENKSCLVCHKTTDGSVLCENCFVDVYNYKSKCFGGGLQRDNDNNLEIVE
jgi:hypothetical protein